MSAVPQLPEQVHSIREPTSKAVLQEMHNNKFSTSHVENAHSNGASVTTETKSKDSVDGVNGDTTQFRMHDTAVENFRPIRVIVIGAGYSGIYHGIRIPERIKNCELVIYEKNAGVGGTWYVD